MSQCERHTVQKRQSTVRLQGHEACGWKVDLQDVKKTPEGVIRSTRCTAQIHSFLTSRPIHLRALQVVARINSISDLGVTIRLNIHQPSKVGVSPFSQ